MRLNKFEIESIKTLANKHFGENVQVFLFGSRTNNEIKGGDIDLFISSTKSENLVVRKKVEFISDLLLQIGEQRVDVVLDNPELRKTVFFQTIHRLGIQLC